MDFTLTEEQELFAKSVREFGKPLSPQGMGTRTGAQ